MKSGSWWSAFYRYWTMINGRNSTDKEILADSAETKAHDMNLFLSTKSEAGHDCAPPQ
ncbi:hypothetical protein [Phocaeicola sartorii]|uniref:hypothetical protein n=1 Tax=Phocaeicola sartorii TaxID=671267 RepID=UPI0025987DF1|nr:hypothetical protein [Phocaeicola sartorii]